MCVKYLSVLFCTLLPAASSFAWSSTIVMSVLSSKALIDICAIPATFASASYEVSTEQLSGIASRYNAEYRGPMTSAESVKTSFDSCTHMLLSLLAIGSLSVPKVVSSGRALGTNLSFIRKDYHAEEFYRPSRKRLLRPS